MADYTKISRKISYLLRHHPEEAKLKVDRYGYVSVKELINAVGISPADLDAIVEGDDKKRFVFSADKSQIKCAQGHSFSVELEMAATISPPILYHGTASRFISAIKTEGLKAMSRLHVHLSFDIDTAYAVGKRHGSPVIFCVDCEQMTADGYLFYQAENGMWLTEVVPPKYLKLYDPNRFTADAVGIEHGAQIIKDSNK